MTTSGDYFRIGKPIGALYDRLNETTDPAIRAELLDGMATIEQQLSDVHREAFGPDPIEWEGGRDLSESIASSALLMRLLADVEHAVADGGQRRRTDTWLEPYAGSVLDRMAATPDIATRSVLLLDLYEAVEPHVGGQAAEVLAGLPYRPGWRGWDDDRYLPNSFPKMVRVLWRTWREGRAA
jgi:hypothetical protein